MSVARIISFGLLARFISVTAASPQAVAQQQQRGARPLHTRHQAA